MDRDTIAALTVLVGVYRKLRAMGIYDMPIELKGIKGKALKAAANLERLNTAYDVFNEAAPLHAADVEGLTPQISAMQDDLQFAAQVLGNSAGQSDERQEPQQTKVPDVRLGDAA